jgi:hypothetical protein
LLTPEEKDEEEEDDDEEEEGPKGVDGVLLLLLLLEASVAPTCPGRDDRIYFNLILYSPSPFLCYDSIEHTYIKRVFVCLHLFI